MVPGPDEGADPFGDESLWDIAWREPDLLSAAQLDELIEDSHEDALRAAGSLMSSRQFSTVTASDVGNLLLAAKLYPDRLSAAQVSRVVREYPGRALEHLLPYLDAEQLVACARSSPRTALTFQPVRRALDAATLERLSGLEPWPALRYARDVLPAKRVQELARHCAHLVLAYADEFGDEEFVAAAMELPGVAWEKHCDRVVELLAVPSAGRLQVPAVVTVHSAPRTGGQGRSFSI